jgi:hypothetical protein
VNDCNFCLYVRASFKHTLTVQTLRLNKRLQWYGLLLSAPFCITYDKSLRDLTTCDIVILYVSIPVCYICVWYFTKTFNTRILNSKIQIPLFWLHVSVQRTIFRPS